MVKTVDSVNGNFTQKCGNCATEHLHLFSALSVLTQNNRIMELPVCTTCNSTEFLILNYGSGDHDIKVIQVFSEVNAT